MKIAIQGHPIRGKEVIQILESLGGINMEGLTGTCKTFYYINHRNKISDTLKSYLSSTHRCYTLEEFKKEFPFKIGDSVQIEINNQIYLATIADIVGIGEYKVKYSSGGIGFINKEYISIYKEMNTRNITLTLDKAKEWYNNGGELKEVALQAFTEQELNPLPKSWEKFLENYCSEWKKEILESALKDMGYYFPNEKLSKFKALLQLEYLRDCYRQGWIPNWSDGKRIKYCIVRESSILNIRIHANLNEFLSFQSMEIAKEFLKNFKPLIKEAGDLI